MLIRLSGNEYQPSEKVLHDLVNILLSGGVEFYGKLSVEKQILIDSFARSILYEMEEKMLAHGANPKEAMKLRPEKGEDASLKFMSIIAANFMAPLQFAEIELHEENGIITNLSYRLEIPHANSEKT